MTTFELPNYLATHLKRLGKELATQDNLHTAWPIWYVTEEVKEYTQSDRAEYKERKDPDFVDNSLYCQTCLTIAAELESDGIPEECPIDRCDSDTYQYYNLERRMASYGSEFFLTQKACQEYINANSYHFRNPQPFAGSAHRNHELQPLIQALILVAGEEVPSNHYGVVVKE